MDKRIHFRLSDKQDADIMCLLSAVDKFHITTYQNFIRAVVYLYMYRPDITLPPVLSYDITSEHKQYKINNVDLKIKISDSPDSGINPGNLNTSTIKYILRKVISYTDNTSETKVLHTNISTIVSAYNDCLIKSTSYFAHTGTNQKHLAENTVKEKKIDSEAINGITGEIYSEVNNSEENSSFFNRTSHHPAQESEMLDLKDVANTKTNEMKKIKSTENIELDQETINNVSSIGLDGNNIDRLNFDLSI